MVQNNFNLPQLVKARLKNFSLYELNPEIEIDFPGGLFCLAGANGLGKSTFLTAINYAITGRVPDPKNKFLSLKDYYTSKSSKEFSRSYFDGRINESDRRTAEVEVQLRINGWELSVIRGMFDPDDVRGLWIQDKDGFLHQVEGTPAVLHARYQKEMINRVGVATFDQLVFLQHFVLTFDERRFLLFWSERELEQTLHLTFGVDAATAKQADVLQDEAGKADSRGRNSSWHAGNLRTKLQDLESAVIKTNRSALKAVETRLTKLQSALTDAEAHLTNKSSEFNDAQLKLAEVSARQTTLRVEFDAEFSKNLGGSKTIRQHPVISQSMIAGHCQLCDSRRPGLAAEIEKRLKLLRCPICGEKVNELPRKSFSRLKELDKQLATIATKVTEAVNKVERLRIEIAANQKEYDQALKELKNFTDKFKQEVSLIEAQQSDGLNKIIDDYKRRIEELEADKRKHYEKRDKYKEELKPIQRRLARQYKEAEEIFVPMFNELAKSFLGVDLKVIFQQRASRLRLIVDIDDGPRREFHQLSESQRFFVDIALRMAVIKYMSSSTSKGELFLDTPEGSLDIAYEIKAGAMIAQFANDGYGSVMTANINTSRLLLALAEHCSPGVMTLLRMTTWANLSAVQKEEEDEFDKAFDAIEQTIRKAAAKKQK